MNKCYSVKETADILNVHIRTIHRLIKTGKLKYLNLGSQKKPNWKIHDTSIQQFIADNYLENEGKSNQKLDFSINEIDQKTKDQIKAKITESIKINENSCWIYPTKHSNCYGMINVKINDKSKVFSAHRLSYLIWKGEVKQLILHICNIKNCCNPDHLYQGNHLDNMHDHSLNCQEKKRKERHELKKTLYDLEHEIKFIKKRLVELSDN